MRFTVTQNIKLRVTNRLSLLLVVALGMTFCATSARAQTAGNCEPGVATKDLDVGNVRAAIYPNGNLFWQGARAGYEVPKDGGVYAIFASGIWVGGTVDGSLRVTAARYGRFQFWPGPIDDAGSAPADCSTYDRIWKVGRADLAQYHETGSTSVDLLEWPTGLGAPTLSPIAADGSPVNADGLDNDSDGTVDEPEEMRSIADEILALPFAQRVDRLIDLAAGERPELLGDQMLWWVMNDVGGRHIFTNGTITEDTDPIGLEVLASAFAFGQAGDLGNTTFYRYRIRYHGLSQLDSAFVGVFSDPDLGSAFDDYVGSDTTLGIGIAYNADNNDDNEYGTAPPAVAYDFLYGPSVDSPGDSALTIGGYAPDRRNLRMTSFMYYNGGGSGVPYTDPTQIRDYYRFMQGLWKDGAKIRASGDGYNTTETATTKFMYPGDAAAGAFWSEYNADGHRTPNSPADRRFIMASGPFSMQPGDEQDILVGIVWARGVTNLDSYSKVKTVDQKIQRFADARLLRPERPDAPVVVASELDQSVVLTWSNPPPSNNLLDTYRSYAPLGELNHPYYEFEGYEVWEFDRSNSDWPDCMEDEDCRLLRVFDVDNGVKEIVGDDDGDLFLNRYAFGTDSGIRHSIELSELINYQTKHYGVRAYAYNAEANPLVLFSPFSRVEATPSRRSDVLSADAVAATKADSTFDLIATVNGVGDGLVAVDIVDPATIRGCEYRVVFRGAAANDPTVVARSDQPIEEGDAVDSTPVFGPLRTAAVAHVPQASVLQKRTDATAQDYDVYCGEEKVLDGSVVPGGAPFDEHVALFDGLELTVLNPTRGIKTISVVANSGGPLDPPQMGTFAVDDSGEPNGFPFFDDETLPTRGIQQTSSNAVWGMAHGGGSDGSYSTFEQRVLRNNNLDRVGSFDYEMRFTAAGGRATRAFDDGVDITVPFELWRIGVDTPDDATDDVRLIPYICEDACGAGIQANRYDIGGDHRISDGADDPSTDWVYWYLPNNATPGEYGYNAWFGQGGGTPSELFARTLLVQLDGGSAPPYDPALPEEGTVFRITSLKQLQEGDVATFTTAGLEPTAPSQSEQVARLDDTGIVPNPYRGSSRYETSTLKDEVRFTNLPDVATIRVFTLNGRLVRTINKNIPGQEWLSWDLRSDSGRHLASGIYLVHVEVPGVGMHVIKFGYVGKRWGD